MIKNGILHVHSMYSLHDSTQSPEDIVRWASEHGCKNITLTDHGSLLGVDDFMEMGVKYGINTIPGVEGYLENREHIILIPFDLEGFTAISHAIRDANANQVEIAKNVYPIITNEILDKLKGNTHIFATSACIQGPIASILLKQYYENQKTEKEQSKLVDLKRAKDEWNNLNQTYQKYAEQVKSIKKEISIYKKLTSASVEKQIAKLKSSIKNTSDPKEAESLNITLNTKLSAKKNADKIIQDLNTQLKDVTEKRKLYKTKADKLKGKSNKYNELLNIVNKKEIVSMDLLYQQALEKLIYLKTIFPKFYLELQYHGLEQERIVMPLIVKMAKETNTPLIAANDAHITYGTDECIKARQIVRYNYFQKHQDINGSDRELYLKEDEELIEELSNVANKEDVADAMDNLSILNKCNVQFSQESHYPKCKNEKTFKELAMEARHKKIEDKEWDDKHEEEFQRELKIIPQMGFEDYHLVVRDYCNVMRKLGGIPKKELKNIPSDFGKVDEWLSKKNFRTGVGVGPGRGSAAGSLICYLLGITNIDPIKYDLLFDRYLNPERVTMPDIDTDVKTSLRSTIIRYFKWRYGEKAVCSIMTKTTYAAKGAIQMVGRDRSSELYGSLDKKTSDLKTAEYRKKYTLPISDLIPVKPNVKLADCEDVFQAKFGNDTESVLLWNRAKLIEGKLFGTGIHAGGIVISDNDDINDYVPLSYSEEDKPQNGTVAKKTWAAQCDMVQLEKRGLLKMDLLGLNTLDVQSDCLQLIEKHHGIVIDLNEIDFEDAVFKHIYAEGNTNSVFQFESDGMKSMLKDFKPTCFEDLILLVAAYRPGPMQFLPDIIARKHKKKPLVYKVPELEPILSTTYGGIIYQEQVMKIFQSLAGYSLGQADMVRRAMSKKKEEKLKMERHAFIYGDPERNIVGCIQNHIKEEAANELFDELTDFAKYAFNKSHAACYAVVSYQTAWLKYHYPVEFECAMFNNKPIEKYGPIYEDCRLNEIEILPVSINKSLYDFSIETGKIRYGFHGIKGIGEENILESIMSERRENGYYIDYPDFILRNTIENGTKKISLPFKKITEALANAGAFDETDRNRAYMVQFYEQISKQNITNIVTLQQIFSDKYSVSDAEIKDIVYNREQEVSLMGTVISDKPLKGYRDEEYYGCDKIGEVLNGKTFIMGYISNITEITSKAGNELILIELAGKADLCTVIFMKKNTNIDMVKKLSNTVVRIEGSVKDGTVFGRKIERLNVTDSGYSISLDTISKTKVAAEIMKPGNECSGAMRLLIQFFYDKSGNLLKTPIIKEHHVSLTTINELKAKKIINVGKKGM